MEWETALCTTLMRPISCVLLSNFQERLVFIWCRVWDDLSSSDKDATLDGPRLAIAGVKDVMGGRGQREGRLQEWQSNVPDEMCCGFSLAVYLAPSLKRLVLTMWRFPCMKKFIPKRVLDGRYELGFHVQI
jgi:hypothetical protein